MVVSECEKTIEGFQVAILEVSDTCQWTTNCFFNDLGMISLIWAMRSSSDEGKLMSSNRHWLHFSPHALMMSSWTSQLCSVGDTKSELQVPQTTACFQHCKHGDWLSRTCVPLCLTRIDLHVRILDMLECVYVLTLKVWIKKDYYDCE